MAEYTVTISYARVYHMPEYSISYARVYHMSQYHILEYTYYARVYRTSASTGGWPAAVQGQLAAR